METFYPLFYAKVKCLSISHGKVTSVQCETLKFDIYGLRPFAAYMFNNKSRAIWTKRNWRSLEDIEKSMDQLLDLCQRTLFD